MIREYEFTLVVKGDLSEADRSKVFAGYEEVLTANGGAVIKKNDWGTKRLAYPIEKNFRGHYVLYNLASTPADIAEAERLIRIDENTLRHFVVKVKDSVDVEARKAELAGEAAKTAKAEEQ